MNRSEEMKRYIVLVVAITLGGCAAEGTRPGGDRPFTNTEAGILLGAAGGALLGAVAYSGNRSRGAVIGAIGGGVAGGAVGAYMDNQKRDLEKSLAKEIQLRQARVDKLDNHVVRVTMTAQTGFDTNSTSIKPGFHSTLDKIADVVVRYGKTTLTVAGHTDDVGSAQYNQQLSERRARAVAQYLESKRVNEARLSVVGKGEGMPIASNATDGGRAENRRVEIYVQPVVEGT